MSIIKRYMVVVEYPNGDKDDIFECTDYRRIDGCLEIYYSENANMIMNVNRPDFTIPLTSIKKFMAERQDVV